ncbi:sulfatase [Catenovulum maritimum]|uniref:sulfatase n=1 Tax=Catenovulum maritimum TaxID=1513271 RepID=UPI0006604FC8|nr:sulfatase [Catenovulum maritimum]
MKLKSLSAALIALAGLSIAEPVVANSDKPLNVLMIAVDDLNNWPESWGGKAKTPNIDSLAAQGVQFTNAHAVVPACNPSRVAVMTGQRPEVTGQHKNEGNFRKMPGGQNRVTLPQLLRKNGYYAAGAGKLFHHPRGRSQNAKPLSDDISWNEQAKVLTGTGGGQHYQDKDGHAAWLKGAATFEGKKISPYIREHGIWGAIPDKTEQTGDWQTAEYCYDFLQKSHDKPFFLGCGIFRPHSPQKYFDMYPIESIELPESPADDMQDIPKRQRNNWSTSFARKVISDKAEWKRAVQAYLASTTFADDCIGRILEGLEQSKYKDNTVVVLWSDHGFQVGTKQRWEKFSLWHQATNAPYIIKAPGVKPARIDQPVSLLSVYPTVIDLVNVDEDTNHKLGGKSLVPLLKQPNMEWPYPAVVTYYPKNHSIRYKNWNYIQYDDGSRELYDHNNDPREYNNLAGNKKYLSVMSDLQKWIPSSD